MDSNNQDGPSFRVDPGAVFLITLWPLLLLAARPDWIVSGLYRDPWIYFGYFLDPVGHFRVYPDAYFSDRPAIILPGVMVYSLFAPFVANLVLHLCVFGVATVGFYGTLKCVAGRRSAFLTALLFSGHWHFLRAVGSDYDGFGIAYFLAAFRCATLAGEANRRVAWAFLAGICTLLLVATNLSYGIFAPFICIQFLVTAYAGGARRPTMPIIAFAAGAGLCYAILNEVHRRYTGQAPLFAVSLEFAERFRKWQPISPFRWPWKHWLPYGVWLVPIFLSLFLSVFAAHRASWRGRWLLAQAWIALVILGKMQRSPGSAVLQAWYYASLLLPLAFLSIGVSLRPFVEAFPKREFRRWSAIAGLAVLAATSASGRNPFPDESGVMTLPPCLTIGAAGCLMLVVFRRTRPNVGFAAFLAAFVLSGALADSAFREERSVAIFATPDLSDPFHPEHSPWRAQGDRAPLAIYGARMREYDRSRLDVLRAILEIAELLRESGGGPDTHFWYDIGERDGVLFDNAACLNQWARVVGNCLPDLHKCVNLPGEPPRTIQNAPLPAGTHCILLCNDSLKVEAAKAELAARGWELREVGRREVAHGSLRFTAVAVIAGPVTPRG